MQNEEKGEFRHTKNVSNVSGFCLPILHVYKDLIRKIKKLANPSLTHVIKNLKFLNCMYTGKSKCMCNLDYMQHDM